MQCFLPEFPTYYPDFKFTLHSFICSCPTKELTLTEDLQANRMPVDLTLDRAEADIVVWIRYVCG